MTAYEYDVETPLARVYFVSPADTAGLDRLCLYLATLPRMSGHLPGTIPDPLDLHPGGPLAGAHYLVAQVEATIVGAVALLRDAPAACHGYHGAHVARIHVDLLPDWREQEVAEALVGGLVEWARLQPGLKRLEFDTLSCNKWVVELLQRVGFVVEGQSRASWYARTASTDSDDAGDEVYLDRIRMGLLLDEAVASGATGGVEFAVGVEPAPETVVARDPSIPDADCSACFAELVGHVRAFLPYELREFETQEQVNELHLLIGDLAEGVAFAVALRLASVEFDTPDMVEIGLHLRRDPDFNRAQIERLQGKLEALGDALGRKTLHADLWRQGWGRVALRLPYQPPHEINAFMLAAQVAGFVQVLLPEVKVATG